MEKFFPTVSKEEAIKIQAEKLKNLEEEGKNKIEPEISIIKSVKNLNNSPTLVTSPKVNSPKPTVTTSKNSPQVNSPKVTNPKNEEEKQKRELERQRLAEERRKKEEEKRERMRRVEEERLEKNRRLEEEKAERAKKLEELKALKEKERLEREELRKQREEDKIKREKEKLKIEQEKTERLRKESEDRAERLKREEEARNRRKEEAEALAQKKAEAEKKRQELIEIKNEEKRKKEEEEEEKRLKNEKVKEKFCTFFIKKKETEISNMENGSSSPSTTTTATTENSLFKPFQLKPNMKLAPISRRFDIMKMSRQNYELFINELDKTLNNADNSNVDNYIKYIKENSGRKGSKTTFINKSKFIDYKLLREDGEEEENEDANEDCDEVQIIDENTSSSLTIVANTITNDKTTFKVKYLHFDRKVYRRPPYYGTWQKKSKLINGRRPFAKDEKLIDYEIDSDDEWEECNDGESIADSKDGDPDDDIVGTGDDDEDDGFLVPHGHLSDDEMDEEDRLLDPETKKMREAAKSEQWEMEKKKTSKYLIPKFFCSLKSIDNNNNNKNEMKLLQKLAMIPLFDTKLPISLEPSTSNNNKNNDDSNVNQTPKAKKAPKQKKTEQEKSDPIAETIVSKTSNSTSKVKKHIKLTPLNNNIETTVQTQEVNSPSTNNGSIINMFNKLQEKKAKKRLEINVSGENSENENPAPSKPMIKVPNEDQSSSPAVCAEKRGFHFHFHFQFEFGKKILNYF
jgi:chromatin assembly factor 1 subunit A